MFVKSLIHRSRPATIATDLISSLVGISAARSLSTVSGQSTSRTINETFKHRDIDIQLVTDEARRRPPAGGQQIEGFGQSFTPHILEIEYDSRAAGWGRPRITPMHHLCLHPAAKVLHYAQELFEGMKAYRGVDGKIRFFRPELNMRRMLASAARLALPAFDGGQLVECIKEHVRVDRDWIPSPDNYQSLYIRPTFIGTQATLGVSVSPTALLYVLLSPSGSYFPTGFRPVSLLADPQYIRAWPGGCGDKKLGANYAPTIHVGSLATDRGLQQVLWLYGEDHQLTEVGTMNIFVLLRNAAGDQELITPPLGNGLILPGVTRQTILEMTRDWGEFKVTERVITMREVREATESGRLLEIFGAGTACVVCPVERIHYAGEDLRIPTMESSGSPLCLRLLKEITDIQYGRVPSHPWAQIVD